MDVKLVRLEALLCVNKFNFFKDPNWLKDDKAFWAKNES